MMSRPIVTRPREGPLILVRGRGRGQSEALTSLQLADKRKKMPFIGNALKMTTADTAEAPQYRKQ